ncbi:hypothetical protein FJT64_008983 [Amphibalanus amphitrite]|uniref:Uncharacterized protein n=1 Tax=Amphibalanus amphitrite TaxID=1232801 RepID=A0A6A4VHM4_AMPAM|nr:hypothetical protein FJT64_008983 [Amphibalanus amphitrite]
MEGDRMWLMAIALLSLLGSGFSECYFPFEYHGTYAVQSAENKYSEVLIEINQIPTIWRLPRKSRATTSFCVTMLWRGGQTAAQILTDGHDHRGAGPAGLRGRAAH